MLRSLQHNQLRSQVVRLRCLQQLNLQFSSATGNVVELSSDDHVKQAVAADTLAVLDFTAKWCGPCKMIAPEYAKMSIEFPKPTFKLMRSGSAVAQLTGADKNGLRKLLQQHAQ